MFHDATVALWLLPATLPLGVYVAWSDLARMKIPNKAVYGLVAAFAVLGLFALPFDVYVWRWTHLPVLLIIGMVLNAIGALGAGDAKFLAAAAPFVALADLANVFYILAFCMFAAYVVHRLAKHTPLHKLAPNWESWRSGKRFPMGFPLAMALNVYLAWPLLS